MRATALASCAGEFMLERRRVQLYAGERELLGLVVPPFQRPLRPQRLAAMQLLQRDRQDQRMLKPYGIPLRSPVTPACR